MESRIDKIVEDVRLQLDFSEDESGFDRDNLFIILKYLEYARLRDETWVTNSVFPLFAHNQSLMSWPALKLLLCAIEGIYLNALYDVHPIPGYTPDHEGFTRLHLFLQPLFISKNHARFLNRERDLESMRREEESRRGFTHRPRLNRRSIEIDGQRQRSGDVLVRLVSAARETEEVKRAKVIEKEAEELS